MAPLTGFAFPAASADDLPLLAGLVGQLYDAHEEAGDAAARRARAETLLATCSVRLIRREGAIVGYAAWQDLGDYVYLRHFLIEAAKRGQGLGRAAFEALGAECLAGRAIRLDASATHPGPRAFWEAIGFQIRGYALQRDAQTAAAATSGAAA